METTGIEDAVAAIAMKLGHAPRHGIQLLARALGVSRQVVRMWVLAGHAPYGRARQIQHHTGVDPRRLVDPVIRDLFGR